MCWMWAKVCLSIGSHPAVWIHSKGFDHKKSTRDGSWWHPIHQSSGSTSPTRSGQLEAPTGQCLSPWTSATASAGNKELRVVVKHQRLLAFKLIGHLQIWDIKTSTCLLFSLDVGSGEEAGVWVAPSGLGSPGAAQLCGGAVLREHLQAHSRTTPLVLVLCKPRALNAASACTVSRFQKWDHWVLRDTSLSAKWLFNIARCLPFSKLSYIFSPTCLIYFYYYCCCFTPFFKIRRQCFLCLPPQTAALSQGSLKHEGQKPTPGIAGCS